MTGARLFLSLGVLFLLAAKASAQIDVALQMARKTFVAGEQISVSVSITNHSGQDLVFQGNDRAGWIDFTVTSSRGVPMTPLGRPAFGAVKIPLGQTMTRTIDLSSLYPLQSMGNYSVYGVVRLPGQTTDGFISNRLLFNVNNALPYWTQKVGVPGKAGQSREYRVLNFTGGQKNTLYSQVVDLRTGTPLQTHSLGEVLMFRKPSVTLDKNQIMHVLYLVGPTVWAHTRVGPDGSLLGRELHKRGAGPDPQLITTPQGVVQVVNGIAYDPRAEAEARGRVRKASDRPAFIFQ
ncbi:hypothetical protein [Luteolibacter marinus]|uniref:hypothetical protein n=1 Tax=Luteolibacter marinus TaxID=2776705 RepID=UPI001867248A|nr:hypothetical protein [Luteolibacter marinus]